MSCLVKELVNVSGENKFHGNLQNNESKRYMKNKILYETVLQCTKVKGKLPDEVIENSYSIILSEDVLQCIKLNDNKYSELTGGCILGLTNIKPHELIYEERKVLRSELEQKLILDCETIHKSMFDIVDEYLNKNPNIEEKLIVDFKQQLNCEQDLYVENLKKCVSLVKDLSNLRIRCLSDICSCKAEEYQVKTEIHDTKCKLLHQKTRMDIFTETSKSLDAYRELIKDIEQQRQQCQCEIENLCELKERYNRVSCRQFETILKSYLEYKNAIEKKMNLFEKIKIK